MISLSIVFALTTIYLWKPIKEHLEVRRTNIETNIDEDGTITLNNDGNGIDKELISVIFEPFITTKRHDGGTGLGLSIVYNLVTQKLKGEVKMLSPDHGGACLHIILENTKYRYTTDEGIASWS